MTMEKVMEQVAGVFKFCLWALFFWQSAQERSRAEPSRAGPHCGRPAGVVCIFGFRSYLGLADSG